MVDAYIEEGEKAPGYLETEQRLYNIMKSSTDIQYIYVYKIMEDGCHVVFDLDTEEIKGEKPGNIIPFDESFASKIPALLKGEEIEPIISDDTYGYLITAYEPVYDSNGQCKCYAASDIAMSLVQTKELSFMLKLISLFMGFFILIVAIGLWLSEYNIILPVNAMAISASKFAYDNEEDLEQNVERIKKLQIHTGDEIENMYQAFSKTTENSVEYMNALHTKTETISEMQNALIMVLADMVENRDENTGDHVRKTAAYTRIIMEKLLEKGIYTDQLTPQFMYDVEHSAPLHDIGKIQISDMILNKPGKLTDEEFEIMKTHTTAGSEILDQVIETVPESSYLKEAKNLAEYHHEKWNGKGYPHGVSGEDIPLSARIMAVADVFDALVSERVYKKAFPFEKAMNIIKEDSGTHFDPNVAEAFIESADKVKAVMDFYNEKYHGR
jgi:response regulator RpfG family c-di-GMP phosphodiesterase